MQLLIARDAAKLSPEWPDEALRRNANGVVCVETGADQHFGSKSDPHAEEEISQSWLATWLAWSLGAMVGIVFWLFVASLLL
ncbi:MAG: hypothetical protein QM659_03825 [Rhodomicrobium sp.]